MSVSVVITNLTSSQLSIQELYVSLGRSGSTNASVTIDRSVAQLDSMPETKALLAAGSISLVPTASANNVDLLSIPLEQHGAVPVSVAVATEVVVPVVFDDPYPAGVVPCVSVLVDKTGVTATRSAVYAENITNTGFDVALVVSVTAGENPVFAPPEGPTLTGPFTATLAAAPLTDNTLVINWTESKQATELLTVSAGPIVDGDTVTVGAQTYTFQDPLVDVADNVFIGADDAEALANLAAAINGGAGVGTLYGTGTGVNASSTAAVLSPTTMGVYAITGGTAGNSLATTTTGGTTSFGAGTMSGGVDTAAKTATLSGTASVGGTDAARIAAATIVRATGALSITFVARTVGVNNGPDANSIAIGYAVNVNWAACY